MKHLRFFLTCLLTLLVTGGLWAQGTPLSTANSGSTFDVTTQSYTLTDDGGVQGDYSAGLDVNCIVTGQCSGDNMVRIQILLYDIAPTDTLYIYDGNSTSARPLAAINNNCPPAEIYYYPSAINTTSSLTIRFVSAANSIGGGGFSLSLNCARPCVSLEPYFIDRYFKARGGEIYDSTFTMGDRIQLDTAWEYDVITLGDSTYNDTTGFHMDTTVFWGLEICEGDSLIIEAHGEYGTGIYTPTDRTTTFHWKWGDGDSLNVSGNGFGGHKFREVGCYDVTLLIEDYIGCQSSTNAQVRVRIALKPIKTLFDLQTMCNTDSLLVNAGFDGDGATLTLQKIEFSKTATKSFPVRTFIPDGPYCGSDPCYRAPVVFEEFPAGRTVHSKDDICSICLDYEHTYMGDYSMAIVCPSGQKAYIKFGQHDDIKPTRDEANNTHAYPVGNGIYTGYPLRSWDSGSGSACDSLQNPFGDGLEYCWSRNEAYHLVTGEIANCPLDGVTANPNGSGFIYIDANSYVNDRHVTSPSDTYMESTEGHVFSPTPAYFTSHPGEVYPPYTHETKRPSNHEEKTDYYLPDANFTELIGCPLNGQWEMELCDRYGLDNGWIFAWSMDICGISSGSCEYQVDIDSIVWHPDSTYGDFDLGHWRGITMRHTDATHAWVASPDTAGRFPVLVTIYDNFGCVWDTNTNITTVWNPLPSLPDSINICGVETVLLDATDAHTPITNQSYRWEPYGDSTATIETRPLQGSTGSTLYTVQVTNTQHGIRCNNRDSVRVTFFSTPIPAFDLGTYPVEGCEPFTLPFDNYSQNGDKYFWEFGDGVTSTAESPIHSYATGQYDLKFFITSPDGCRDSIILPELITVFPSPQAKFSWEPINPTVLHPEVSFINKTEPQTDDVKFYWEIQYDKNNPLSYHTMRELNPTFTWQTDGEDISGPYIARLIAKTDQRGPSGHVLECRDTVENTILLVNDFLQFPNVITANGDGVNDVFEIKNLVNGLGYPNNSLAIYNRWGKRVYFKQNIASEEDFWDPAKENIPAGTYFWRFSGKGYLGDIERNGTVEVMR